MTAPDSAGTERKDSTNNRSVPHIGETFVHNGQSYAVRGWARRADQSTPATGDDHVALLFATRDDAEYVIAADTAGTIVPIADIQTTGRALWAPATVETSRRVAEALAGQPIHP